MPAFKKKGESALLECKYELKKWRSTAELHGFGMSPGDEELDREASDDYDEEPFSDLGSSGRHRTNLGHSRRSSAAEVRRVQDEAAEGDKFYEASEALYSVKWYKDNEEFYRYLPKSNPPQHSYRVEGIRVDVSIQLPGIGRKWRVAETAPLKGIPKTPPCKCFTLSMISVCLLLVACFLVAYLMVF